MTIKTVSLSFHSAARSIEPDLESSLQSHNQSAAFRVRGSWIQALQPNTLHFDVQREKLRFLSTPAKTLLVQACCSRSDQEAKAPSSPSGRTVCLACSCLVGHAATFCPLTNTKTKLQLCTRQDLGQPPVYTCFLGHKSSDGHMTRTHAHRHAHTAGPTSFTRAQLAQKPSHFWWPTMPQETW